MKAEKMRHRITFQVPSDAKDVLGGYSDSWTDAITVWAQISPVSGREYSGQVQGNAVTHKIYCRYLKGISPQLRVKFGERTFRIISVLNWEERNKGLTIMCEEITPIKPSEALMKALKEQIGEGL